MYVCVNLRVWDCIMCANDCFFVPFAPRLSLAPWQCFPYMHMTHRVHMCKHGQTPIASGAGCQVRRGGWWAWTSSFPSIPTLHFLEDGEKGAWCRYWCVTMMAFFPERWATSGGVKKKKKKALFTREDGLRSGGPACQAFHGTQWTHYYDSYKAG